jgi:hypothetical protein
VLLRLPYCAARGRQPTRRIIADFRAAAEYRATSQQIGLADVATHPLEWRFWYGGPRV